MRPVQVRPARPDDARLAELLRTLDDYLYRCYPREEAGEITHILDAQALAHPSVTFLAAWSGDEALGCGAVRRMSDAQGPYAEVKRMFVQPHARGQRIGEHLLAALEAAVQSEGITRLLLETGTRQPEALRLYERTGWRRCGPFGGYPDHPLSVFMEKAL